MKFHRLTNGELPSSGLYMVVGVESSDDYGYESDLDQFVEEYNCVIVKRYPETQNAKYIDNGRASGGHTLQPAIIQRKE